MKPNSRPKNSRGWPMASVGVTKAASAARTLERPDVSREELERYYGPGYAARLYRDAPMPQATR